MSDFNNLIEKLTAYETLGDVVNRRKIVEELISEYPGKVESWYAKAKLLSNNFSGDNISSEFDKCMGNIMKLSGKESPQFIECEVYRDKVLAYKKEVEEEERKKQEIRIQEEEKRKKALKIRGKKTLIKTLKISLVVVPILSIVIYFLFPVVVRRTFSSEEEMITSLKGRYIRELGFTDKKGEYHMSSKSIYNIDGSTINYEIIFQSRDIDDKTGTSEIVSYNPGRGYFKTSGDTKYVVLKNGDIKLFADDAVFSRR